MNHFCLGSDPEFVFVEPGNRTKTSASDLGLLPGLAAGCDQNFRLAELRGFPTTSVIEHVAGLLASLRWMFRVYPTTGKYYWRAGAFYDGDGLGGHVHFGRKRPSRDLEVAALDGIAKHMMSMELFDVGQWNKRQEPDQHNNHGYGKLGDFRIQSHGYEYRTLPSWLCSPLKAFVVLTLSKLSVLDPELTIPWQFGPAKGFQDGLSLMHRLARYYAGRDDDAWTLKHLLNQPAFQKSMGRWNKPESDFKGNWGFGEELRGSRIAASPILPSVIAPCKAEIGEIQEHISTFKPLTFQEHPPTFRSKIPKDYYWQYSVSHQGLKYPGAGDIAHDLVMHQKAPVLLTFDNKNSAISEDLIKSADQRQELTRCIPGMVVTKGLKASIILNRHDLNLKTIPRIKAFLTSGMFPIWTVDSVQEGSFDAYLKTQTASSKRTRERIL